MDDNGTTGLDFATISGSIDETGGASGLGKTGGGVLYLTGNNSYTGGTWINNGTLVVTSIGHGSATSSLGGNAGELNIGFLGTTGAAIPGRIHYLDAHFAATFLVFYFRAPIKSVSPIQSLAASMLHCEN